MRRNAESENNHHRKLRNSPQKTNREGNEKVMVKEDNDKKSFGVRITVSAQGVNYHQMYSHAGYR